MTIFEIDEMRSWPRWTWVFNIFDTLLLAERCPPGRPNESLLLPSTPPPHWCRLPKDWFTGDAGVIVIGGSADGVSSTNGATSTGFMGKADIVWFDIEPSSPDLRMLSKEDLAECAHDQKRASTRNGDIVRTCGGAFFLSRDP